jgi:hypothetical protein
VTTLLRWRWVGYTSVLGWAVLGTLGLLSHSQYTFCTEILPPTANWALALNHIYEQPIVVYGLITRRACPTGALI